MERYAKVGFVKSKGNKVFKTEMQQLLEYNSYCIFLSSGILFCLIITKQPEQTQHLH